MLETVASCCLTVDEKVLIRKNRLEPKDPAEGQKRIAIVTGIHGDELEGQYVCYELIRRITRNLSDLNGIVDVYPMLNPLGADSVSRQIPLYDLDMNKIFPGDESTTPWELMAKQVVEDIRGADICVDIHSSDIFLREIPQVRISPENSVRLLPYAKLLNADFVWVGNSSAVRPSSLSHTLNETGTPCLVVEMGAGMNEIVEIVLTTPEVSAMHRLRTRRIGMNRAIEFHVKMDGGMTLAHAHEIASEIERRLRSRFGAGTIINIHMEPAAPLPYEIPDAKTSIHHIQDKK